MLPNRTIVLPNSRAKESSVTIRVSEDSGRMLIDVTGVRGSNLHAYVSGPRARSIEHVIGVLRDFLEGAPIDA